MDENLTPDKIRQFVKKYFAEHHRSELSFHTYSRAVNVVRTTEKIASQYKLSKEELFALLAAAWFHSTGYLINKDDCQTSAADLAVKFLTSKRVDHLQIERVSSIIMAPLQSDDDNDDVLARILLDARFYYLGTEEFLKKLDLQRKEKQWLDGKKISKADWLCECYQWIADYKFHTICTLEKLKPRLEKNLVKLKEELLDQLIIDDDKTKIADQSDCSKKKSPKYLKKE